ncbi:MAG: hypothetical protein QOD63_2213, partial [Actinomycetota bacterium]|jgi:hypothetical protein|nr:hypothetical protein [Actinomycetota bacterium]
MDGIRLQGGLAQHNVWYTGWRSAQVNYSDHTYSSWVHANDNYYAEYFPSAPASIGDHVRLHCQYDGNRMGSIGIGPTGQMVSYTFLGGHLGVSPYSIYIEAGAGGGHVSIQSSRFIGTSFEGVGNAHIYSAGKTAWMIGTLFQDVGNWSMYPVSTYNIAANDHAACWYLGEMVDVRIRGGSQNPLGLGSTAAIDCPTIQGLSWEGYKSTLTAAIAASLPVILTDVINAPGIALSDGADRAIAGLCYPSAVSAGQITAAGLNGPYLTPYAGAAANGGGIIQGVALTAGSVVGSGRQAAIVQIEGQVAVNCAVTGVVNNEVLVPDTATPSSVTRAVLSPSSMLKPVIGARVSGDGTGGTVTIKLGIGQRPTITPPTVTGSRGANAALASLLTQLAAAGVIVDSSS